VVGRTAIVGALIVLALAGCASPAGSGSSSPSPRTAPAPSATAAPSALPSASGPTASGAVVTLRVADETYRIRLVDPADVAIARDILAGRRGPLIPNGRIVRGTPDVNTGYSWHIDPVDFEWAEVTIELCDGRPSNVSAGSLSGDRYCPWAATVIAVE
jgi:hypothetical protein